ncbi:hypothetical protein BDZ89DRAFT_1162239 [Hymenopellis radicata]|nr:hypothetical protein BDZ89DRAFT_1162239 [Hymenopellis radicata]
MAMGFRHTRGSPMRSPKFYLTSQDSFDSPKKKTSVAKHLNTATIILGASRPEQIVENLKAFQVPAVCS